MSSIKDRSSSPSAGSPSSFKRSSTRSTSSTKRQTNGRNQQSLRKQSSSASSSVRNTWKLKYQDFTNGSKDDLIKSDYNRNSQMFLKLITKANEWLLNNQRVQVNTCEVVTWMSPDRDRLESEQMFTSRQLSEGSKTYHLRGLRLWLVPQPVPRAQTLCFEDFVPDSVERIPDLVEKINKKIEKKQLRGRILAIQTVHAPVVGGRILNNITSWVDDADVDCNYSFLLRVFYLSDANKTTGYNKNPLVGLKDIVPEVTDEGYEGFEVLIDKTNAWLRDQADLMYVSNMQSIIVQQDESCPEGIGSSCRYSIPGVNVTQTIEFFRILRVAYLRQPTSSSCPVSPTETLPVCPFTFETITPQLMKAVEHGEAHVERLESMKETFSKVIAFLRNSDADVICAETVANPMHLYRQDFVHPQRQISADDIQFLLTIRLYLSGQTGNECGRPIKRVTSSNHGSPNEAADGEYGGNKDRRTSPLFLQSVVTRQFKYRWLVLAVSAFTCMAIIVVVSVVYSNK